MMSTIDKDTGMTVNERLFASSKTEEFDQAVLTRDVNKLKEILKEIGVDDSSIQATLERLSLTNK
jgi:hypothetical protein